MFPALPQQSGYNKRLRTLAPTMSWLIGALGALSSIADDDVWVVGSTPVECARSRERAQILTNTRALQGPGPGRQITIADRDYLGGKRIAGGAPASPDASWP